MVTCGDAAGEVEFELAARHDAWLERVLARRDDFWIDLLEAATPGADRLAPIAWRCSSCSAVPG